MTYFAFTPPTLKNMNLKIAIVFLHDECMFELWLTGRNRKVQAEFIELLSQKDLGLYALSEIHPGVDSIVTSPVVKMPDFDNSEALMKQIEAKSMEFAKDMESMLK